MRTQTGGTVALPGRHCWRASVLRVALYSENFLSTYNLDYESIKLVTANIPVRNGRARVVLWHRRIGQVVGRVGWRCTRSNLGIPGPTHTGTLHCRVLGDALNYSVLDSELRVYVLHKWIRYIVHSDDKGAQCWGLKPELVVCRW